VDKNRRQQAVIKYFLSKERLLMEAQRIFAVCVFINNFYKGRKIIQKVLLFADNTKLFKVDGSVADCEGLE